MTNESGRQEVYVRPSSGDGAAQQVSTAGGAWPRWRRDTREMFYLAPDRTLVAVPVVYRGARLEIGAGRPLFTMRTRPQARLDAYSTMCRRMAGGSSFNSYLEQSTSAAINLVIDWPSTLKQQ